MIYVLFGPPGVGKTYVGQLLSRSFNLPFFDADTLINAEEKSLLQVGLYDQKARDKFVGKLINHVRNIIDIENKVQDLLIAEAFTKEKNRVEFVENFPDNVVYIMIDTPIEVAKERALRRYSDLAVDHVINNVALEFIWHEFEKPKIIYMTMNNYGVSDDIIVKQFVNLIKLLENRK